MVAAFLFSACAGAPAPVGGKGFSPASDARTVSSTAIPTGAKGGSPSPMPGDPVANCTRKPTGGPMVVIAGMIYDVTDPVHPALLCQVSNTVAHLFTGDTFQYIRRSGDTGTEVVLHSMGSGNESVVSGWPLQMGIEAWSPDGSKAAAFVPFTDGAGTQWMQVWLFDQPSVKMIFEFRYPLTDCICRFGIPPPTLAFSADLEYLVEGWPVGKGAVPLHVYRVADPSTDQDMDIADLSAVWSRTGHTLYLGSSETSATQWSPEGGFAKLAGANAWQFQPGLSPDGSAVAYTAYSDPAHSTDLRVYVYDLARQATRTLTDQMRSQVTFVKDGWVWYFQEQACTSCAGGTQHTGRVLAMDIATGVEQAVVFAAGEAPRNLVPGEFWPSS